MAGPLRICAIDAGALNPAKVPVTASFAPVSVAVALAVAATVALSSIVFLAAAFDIGTMPSRAL
jgi:hypothetical protein